MRTRAFGSALAALVMMIGASAAVAQSLAAEADRRTALTHYRHGQELLASEQFEKAAEAFRAAITFEPLLTDAHYELGHAYMGLQRYASAIQAFGGCIEAAMKLYDLGDRDRFAADRAIDEELRELNDTLRRRRGEPLKVMQLEARISEVERSRSSLGTPFVAPGDGAPGAGQRVLSVRRCRGRRSAVVERGSSQRQTGRGVE